MARRLGYEAVPLLLFGLGFRNRLVVIALDDWWIFLPVVPSGPGLGRGTGQATAATPGPPAGRSEQVLRPAGMWAE